MSVNQGIRTSVPEKLEKRGDTWCLISSGGGGTFEWGGGTKI